MEQYQDMLRNRFSDSTFEYRAGAFRSYLQIPKRDYKESPTTKEYVEIREGELESMIGQEEYSGAQENVQSRYNPDFFVVHDIVPESTGQVIFVDLKKAVREYPELMKKYVYREAGRERIECLINSAWGNGYFLYIPKGARDVKLKIESAYDASYSSVSKSVIIMEEDSQASITDIYENFGNGEAVQGRNVYLFLGERAKLQYNYLQEKKDSTVDVCFIRSFLENYAELRLFHINAGGKKVLFYNESDLRGEGSDFRTYGTSFSDGDQRMDVRDSSFQTGKSCNADIQVRGVVRGSSSTLHRGNVDIEEESSLSTGYYDSRILLLSADGYANSKPALIIRNSNTKSKHGSAISNVDTDQMTYLRSRGIPVEVARSMIIEGFVTWNIEKSGEETLIDRISRYSGERNHIYFS